jgi:hypothetical protein
MVQKQSFIDSFRIGKLGVSGGGSFTLKAMRKFKRSLKRELLKQRFRRALI